MKNRIFKVISIVIVLVVVLAVLSLVASYMTAKDMERTLKNIKSESDYIPAVSTYGSVYMDGNIYNLYEAVKDYNEDYLVKQVLCVYNKRFYIHVSRVNQAEYIASVGMENMDLSFHAQFDWTDNMVFTDDRVIYNDGTVIVTDGVNVLEYDIVKDESKTVLAEDYSFPEVPGDYSVSITDSEKIELKYNGESTQFVFAKIAETSAGAAELYSYKNKKTWCGDSRFDGLYVSGTWSTVDSRIYVVAKCKSFDGTLFASILEFDPDENKWVYVSGGYDCGGSIDGEYCFKIVPRL